MKRSIFRLLTVCLSIVAATLFAGTVFAQGNGNGGGHGGGSGHGGGGQPNAPATYQLINIGSFGGDISVNAINDSLELVGAADLPNGEQVGYLYSVANGLKDINELAVPPVETGWVVKDATAINSFGVITGWAEDGAGARRGFLFDARTFEFSLLPEFDGRQQRVWTINDQGCVAGELKDVATNISEVFVYDGTDFELLGVAPGGSWGLSINFSDFVVAPREIYTPQSGWNGIDDDHFGATNRLGVVAGTRIYTNKRKTFRYPMRRNLLTGEVFQLTSNKDQTCSDINDNGDVVFWDSIDGNGGAAVFMNEHGAFKVDDVIGDPSDIELYLAESPFEVSNGAVISNRLATTDFPAIAGGMRVLGEDGQVFLLIPVTP